MSAGASQNGHSAKVEMHLLAAGRAFRIAHLSPQRLRLEDPIREEDRIELPPSEAASRVQVDEETFEWPVHLPDGISPNGRDARIAPVRAAVNV